MRSFIGRACLLFAVTALACTGGSEHSPAKAKQALCSEQACFPYLCNETGDACTDYCPGDDAFCAVGAHCEDRVCVSSGNAGDCTLYAPSSGPEGGCNTSCNRDSDCTTIAYCDQATNFCVLDRCVGASIDDGLPCTVDSCDRVSGVSHVSRPINSSCSDSNLCNGAETCDGGSICRAGTPVVVNDGDACTTDTCDPVTGAVAHTPIAIDDHNPCTTDTCNPASGLSHLPRATGSACDDDNVCNGHETCNSSGQCTVGAPPANGTSCSRGNLCFADTCQSGTCSAGSALPISDSDSCTLDTCTPAGGVQHHACNSLDRTVSTVLADAASFLYTGSNPVQTGVPQFLIDPARISVVRGHVLARSSAPLPGVKVSVPDHPSWGSTVSQGNGDFDLVVNGGQNVRLRFELDPYLPVERTVFAPGQDYVTASNVVMTAPDSQVTVVDLSGSQSAYQVARGSVSTDSSGTRRATLLVPPGVQGSMTLPDSSSQALPSMHFRATEYSVGTTGLDALPATLPASAAYAYAVSLAADEARAVQASKVEFSQPLSLYVENFLGFSVGTTMPYGFHDPATGAWVPSSKGTVLKILSVSGGQATVDFTGDNQADSGSSIGLVAGELQQLASLYGVGQTLVRTQLSHFTNEDGSMPAGGDSDCPPVRCVYQGAEVPCVTGLTVIPCTNNGLTCSGSCPSGTNTTGGSCNGAPYQLSCCPPLYNAGGCGGSQYGTCVRDTGFGGVSSSVQPACDYPPPPAPPDGNGPGDCDQPHNSTIRCQRQSLGEDLAIAGTPYSLHYESDRQLGRKPELRIPVTTDRTPPGLLGIDLRVSVAGRVIDSTFSPSANQSTLFVWDGKDVYGRLLQGSQVATVELSNRFSATYRKSDVFGLASDSLSLGVTARQPLSVKKSWQGNLELWDTKPSGLGGWSLNVNHVYDISGRVLRMGDGKNRSLTYIPPIIRTVAGNGGGGAATGDGGLATVAATPSPTSVAIGPDGRVYVSDGHACVRMIDSNGLITTFAGNCLAAGFAGDGAPATSARLQNPTDVAVGSTGAVYIADSLNHRIRRVGPDGIINTVAGSGPTGVGSGGLAGDGGPAQQARLNSPSGIDVGSDGVVYIADTGNARIRSLGSDGIIRTIAGGGTASPGNEGAATAAVLGAPSRVRFRQDGSLFIAEPSAHVVRRIGPEGMIHAYAGNTSAGYYGDGTPAKGALLKQPTDIGIRNDGSVLILDQNNTVRLVVPSGTISTLAGIAGSTASSGDNGLAAAATFQSAQGIRVAPDGNVYLACTTDNLVRRISPALGGFSSSSDLIEFASADGQTVDSFDGHGRHLQTSSALTGAVLLQFGYDIAGRLTSVTDADNNVTHFDHDASGNPTLIRSPFGQQTTLSVDAHNYLASVVDPAGYQTSFTYDANGLLLSKIDANLNESDYTYDTDGRLATDQDSAGGKKTLTRTDSGGGFSVNVASRLGRTSSFQTVTSPNGKFSRSNAGPDQLPRSLAFSPDGTTTSSAPDGTITISKQSPDPRFGMLAPTVSTTTRFPSGLTRTQSSVRSVTRSGGNVTSLTETSGLNGKIWTRVFNVGTRTWTSTSPLNRQTTLVVDALGRDKSFTIPGITTRSTHFDSHGRIDAATQGVRNQVFSYFDTQDNSNGYLESSTNALSQRTSFTRDARGRVLTTTEPGNITTTLTWDGLDNMTSLAPPDQPAHGLSYTPVSLLSQYSPPPLASISAPETTYTYDYDRKLTNITRPDGLTLDYGYDSAGRLSTLTTATGVVTTTYYDSTNCGTGCALGRRRQVLNPSEGVNVAFSYDGGLDKGISWSGNVAGSVSWSYDANLRKITEIVSGTSGSSSSVAFGYDDDGLLTCVSPSSCSPPGNDALVLTRDSNNGVVTGTSMNFVSTTRQLNAFGELAQEFAIGGSSYIQSDSYDVPAQNGNPSYPRDALGRVLRKTEGFSIVPDIKNTDYEYSNGRLWRVFEQGSTTPARTYGYDDNGNRLSLTSATGTITATYDAQDRLESYGNYLYTYTDNGELKTKTDTTTGATTTYTYDAYGNLKKVELPNSDVIDYVVDGENRRVAKKKNGNVVRRWLYNDKIHPVAELNADGTIAKRFVYASGKNSPDIMIMGGTVFRILSDELGSPRVVRGQTTGTYARMRHDEFGNVLEDSMPGLLPFGFAGGLYDPDTGLVRFGARDYDPVVGRWISKDPIRFGGGQANLYAYVGNDPVNGIDPGGLLEEDPGCIAKVRTQCEAGCRNTCGGALDQACFDLCFNISKSFCRIEDKKAEQDCRAWALKVFGWCVEDGHSYATCAAVSAQAYLDCRKNGTGM